MEWGTDPSSGPGYIWVCLIKPAVVDHSRLGWGWTWAQLCPRILEGRGWGGGFEVSSHLRETGGSAAVTSQEEAP